MSGPNIPFSLAIEALKDYCTRVDELDVEYMQKRREAIANRNEAIIDAVQYGGYPVAKIARVCGISRTRVYQIINGEDSTKE